MKNGIVVLAFFAICLGALVAEDMVIWSSQVVSENAQHKKVRFSGLNKSSRKIVVETLASDCSCTVPALKWREIPPGSSIVVEADWKITEKNQTTDPKVVITLDTGETYQLSLRDGASPARLAAVSVFPEKLVWKAEEAGKCKVLRVRTASNEVSGIQNMNLASGRFFFQMINRLDSQTFEITICNTGALPTESVAAMMKLTSQDEQLLQAVVIIEIEKGQSSTK
jgi:hypothetical protein